MLYTHYLLGVADRQEAARRAMETAELVNGIAFAHNEPKRIEEWRHDLCRKHGLLPPVEATQARARRMAKDVAALKAVPYEPERRLTPGEG